MAGRKPTLLIAWKRFLQKQCPLCGKGERESKGLENRIKMGDMFCHSCGRSWTNKTVLQLEHELSMNGRVPSETASPLSKVLSRTQKSPPFFPRLFKKIATLVGK